MIQANVGVCIYIYISLDQKGSFLLGPPGNNKNLKGPCFKHIVLSNVLYIGILL